MPHVRLHPEARRRSQGSRFHGIGGLERKLAARRFRERRIGQPGNPRWCRIPQPWLCSPIREGNLLEITKKDLDVKPGKRISPADAIRKAQALVAAGQASGVNVIETKCDEEKQKAMIRLNVRGVNEDH